MSYAIVVGSYRGSPWLANCLDSIPSRFPTIVVRNGGYECGALRYIMDNTTLDEFLFLQDSTAIKKTEWLDEVFAKVGTSISINAEPCPFGMFMGKLRRQVLQRMAMPETKTKLDAVFAEMAFGTEYYKLEPSSIILWPDLTLGNTKSNHLHGRDVRVYENDFFVKYKSTWNADLIAEAESRDRDTESSFS